MSSVSGNWWWEEIGRRLLCIIVILVEQFDFSKKVYVLVLKLSIINYILKYYDFINALKSIFRIHFEWVYIEKWNHDSWAFKE